MVINIFIFQRLKDIKDSVTGHLYGVMYNNTLTVLTFSVSIVDNIEGNINHTMLQLHMPAEVYLCGVLHIDECEKKLPDTFQDIDITDNPLFLKYSHQHTKIETYFYIHQKLEPVNNVNIINESDIQKEFIYIRLRGNLPLIAQNGNVPEVLEESRKNIASGKIGIQFPSKNAFLFNNNGKDASLRELLDMPEYYEKTANVKKGIMRPAGIVDVVNANILLKLTGDRPSEEYIKYAPVLQYVKRPFQSLECNLCIDTLSLVNLNVSSADLYGILVESMCRNIKLIEKCFEDQMKQPEHSIKLPVPIHFKPQGLGHLLSVVYPNGHTDKETVEYRECLHKILGLDMTRPRFRNGNAVKFYNESQTDSTLTNPHEAILQNDDILNGTQEIGIVQGLYAYHHYMQDNFDDNGWGCAYRSLQTIISWFRLQGYTEIPIPSHRTIQKCLVDIGDKPSNFINSKQWIGSTEVGFVLEVLLGINVKILCASTGEEVSTLASDLIHHFQTQGTPVMIGGGVLAHTILGVSYNRDTEEVKFLILDPHYTGADHLPNIINKRWCGWKSKDFWKKDAFYNMCLPQRPLCI
ncbi:putative Ufm1-specific protease 2 [Dufourea novaeangliae]|uniref:Probable Ufm1-specific protease 2 n=1 Tax=Dufourea novaeangliae TaxID=178035 RepID=A0A154PFP5_DUFNO|nr:putative Ufm1-specific protease 2 [Dufourea novaeangliae]